MKAQDIDDAVGGLSDVPPGRSAAASGCGCG